MVKNIYDGIDVRYYFEGENFRYDFIIHPNADYKKIALEFTGQDSIFIRGSQLILKTTIGEIVYSDIKVFQESQQKRGSFKMLGPGLLGFELENINPEQTILIDPIIWSTYINNHSVRTHHTPVLGPIVDNSGNVVIASSTNDPNYPTTVGAYQRRLAGAYDVVVTKLNSSGTDLVFCTYIGGSQTSPRWVFGANDIPYTLKTSNGEDIFIIGETESLDYPQPPGFWREIVALTLSQN